MLYKVPMFYRVLTGADWCLQSDGDGFTSSGGVVHIIEKDKITTRHLKARMD